MKKVKHSKLSANDNIAPKNKSWVNALLWIGAAVFILAGIYYLALPSSWVRFAASS